MSWRTDSPDWGHIWQSQGHEALMPVSDSSNSTSILSNVVTQLYLVLNFSHSSLCPRAKVSIGGNYKISVGSHYARRNFVFSLCKNKLFYYFHFLYQIF